MVFSLSAKEEATRKPLFGGKNRATHQFFDLLIKQTYRLAETAGVDVVWFDERRQVGLDFGSRFTNAFAALYAQGYDNVISIGNDSPDLTTAHIETALHQLKENKIVLGPSHDGGVYLIGMHRSHFDAAVFERLPWQKDTLFNKIIAGARGMGTSIFCLDLLHDLDSLADVFAYAKKNPFHLLARLAQKLVAEAEKGFGTRTAGVIRKKRCSTRALRAPPYFKQAA